MIEQIEQTELPPATHWVHSYTHSRARICVCGEIRCPGAHGDYWVTVRNNHGDYRFLAGPYKTHVAALAKLREAKKRAWDSGDPRAPWYAYGTARTTTGSANLIRAIFGKL